MFVFFLIEISPALLAGAVSIANPPLVRQAGKNYYVYALGEAPENWPQKK